MFCGWCGRFSEILNSSCLLRDLHKQHRPLSDCFLRSSLIGVLPVCYSDVNFVDFSTENQHYTVETLYPDNLYNSKILYNVTCIMTQMYQFSLNLNSLQKKFSLTSNYLGTKAVGVERVDCIKKRKRKCMIFRTFTILKVRSFNLLI